MLKHVLILSLIAVMGLGSMAFMQAPAPAPLPAQKPPEEPPPPLSVPKDYRYNGRGRRDPFVNPVPRRAPAEQRAAAPPDCPPGLKGVLVANAAIAGVVTSREPSMNIAVIAAPGGKTYFARVGDALCDAVVTSIKLDTVTFALTVPPGQANDQKAAAPREIVRKVRPATGENK
jgi:hypothetical protein